MANKWKAGDYMGSGLSKSQYLAKQSAPKKTTTVKKSTGSSNNSYTGPYAPGYTGPKQSEYSTPVKPNYYSGPYSPDYTGPRQSGYDQPIKSSSNSSSSKKSSSKSNPVNTSQRNTASGLVNSVLGIPTAEAATTGRTTGNPSMIKKNTSSFVGDLFNLLGQSTKGVAHALGYSVPDLGLSEALGINKDILNPLQNTEGMSPQVAIDNNGMVTGSTINGLPSEDVLTGRNNQSSGNLGQDFANSYFRSTGNNNPRTSNRVSNPTPSTNISSAYQESTPSFDFSQSIAPNYQENIQPNNGTVRQFLGNGYLSNGMASNGKGNYGVEGTLSGGTTDQGNIVDDLLTILGIKPMTAQADTIPQTNGFGMPVQNPYQQPAYSYQGSGDYQKWMSQLYPNGQDNQGDITQRASNIPQTVNNGGVAQQYSQPQMNPVTNQMSTMIGGYDKRYKQQERAFIQQQKDAKKALNELLKQINRQYGVDKESGQSDLEKSKQQDLQRLASQFDFANSAPNDEQRIQYQGRLMNDYTGKLNDLLNRLNQARTSQISSAKQNYQSNLSDLSSQNQNILNDLMAKRSNMQLDIAKMQQEAINKANKGGSSKTKNASFTKLGVDANGKPIYWDNVNNTLFNGVPEGTRNAVDPISAYLQQIAGNQGGQQQGGSWETLPDGSRVWVTD